MSNEICMQRCSWEDDCNWYMNMDEEDFNEEELETCAGMAVQFEDGCYDQGFCSDVEEAREWVFWLWPDFDWIEEEGGIYYWLPYIWTDPPGCQLEYKILEKRHIEWEYSDWCDEEMIVNGHCYELKLQVNQLDETVTERIYMKVEVSVVGTSTSKVFWQVFQWDWEMYNQQEQWEDEYDDLPEITFEVMFSFVEDYGLVLTQEVWELMGGMNETTNLEGTLEEIGNLLGIDGGMDAYFEFYEYIMDRIDRYYRAHHDFEMTYEMMEEIV